MTRVLAKIIYIENADTLNNIGKTTVVLGTIKFPYRGPIEEILALATCKGNGVLHSLII